MIIFWQMQMQVQMQVHMQVHSGALEVAVDKEGTHESIIFL